MKISNTKIHNIIILIGDFNARTGSLEDILKNNNTDNIEE